MVSILVSGPCCPGLNPSIPESGSKEKIVDVAEVDQQRFLEESGEWVKMLIQPI